MMLYMILYIIVNPLNRYVIRVIEISKMKSYGNILKIATNIFLSRIALTLCGATFGCLLNKK